MQKYVEPVSPFKTVSFRNGTQLTTPFSGEATQWTNDSDGFRAPRLPAQRDTMPALDKALEEMEFVEQETIHLDATSLPKDADRAFRNPSASEKVLLQPAAALDGSPQVVLYADEAGGLSWHLPDDFFAASPQQDVKDLGITRASAKRSFTISTRTAAARRGLDSGQAQMRGPITAIGRKVLKVFVIPVVAKLLANPMERIVGAVERKHAQNLIRAVTPANFNQRVDAPFTDWKLLAGKRSLLIVHGIISSTDGMLSKLSADAMTTLSKQYEGRVIAYDHCTLTMDPDANATTFLNQLKLALPDQEFNFDILCHSRGGIVSRALVERRQTLLPRNNCKFGNVFFVATPNAGSALGDAEHIVDMLDVFTNLLTKLPDGPAAYVIEALLAVLKLLAYTAETALPGLAAMGTQGYIKTVLNEGSASISNVVYGAAAANYDPDPNSPNAFCSAALNAVVDRTFAVGGKPVGNDLVVPFDGVYAANGSAMFPIANPLLFGPTDFVYHNDFFAHTKTIERISDFFHDRGVEVADAELPDLAPSTVRGSGLGEPIVKGDPGSLKKWGITKVGGRGEPIVKPGGTGQGSPTRGNPMPKPGGGRGSAAGEPMVKPKSPTFAPGAGGSDWGSAPHGAGAGEPADYGDEGFRGGYGVEPAAAEPEPSDRNPFYDAMKQAAEETDQPLSAAAPTGAPSQAPGPEVTLRREPEISFHERVTAGDANDLTVTLQELTQQDAGSHRQLELALAAGQESVTVNVLLSATGFDVTPDSASMTVSRVRDPKKEQATFTLTAHDVSQPAPRAIHADFLLGTSVIGSVTHFTCVVPRGYDKPGLPCESQIPRPPQGFAVPRKARMECDWALAVAGEGPEYRVSLTSRLPNSTFDFRPMGVLKIEEADMAKYLSDILSDKFSKFPRLVRGMDSGEYKEKVAAWKADFSDTMGAVGKRLWQWLPEDLRTEYFDQYRAGTSPTSILIHSDEMIFPWELLVPNETKIGKLEVLKPLGVAHVLGRWKPGLNTKPKEQMMKVRRFRVLNPNYPPPDTLQWAAQEAQELEQQFPNLVSLVKPADLSGVMKLFNESDVQVLHFSGHGDVNLNNPDLNKILLENSTQFEALKLVATNLCNVAQPVVYMNACSVGNVGVTVGRAGGFASNFVTNGCSGVIAPLWPINDKSSKEFALALYAKLKLGRSIGEALQQLRDQNAQDPTYCAYTFFGDPWVRLNFTAA